MLFLALFSLTQPNDPLFDQQTALAAIHAPRAWMRSVGAPEVVVAVLDTGIRPHPDLDGRLLPGWDFVSDAANAGDGDGRDPDPSDTGSDFHGLHIAGIIGAESNNGVGMAGLDWHCRVLPVRVLGKDRGVGAESDIADAIRWAAGLHVDGVPDNLNPASVINLSFDGRGRSSLLQAAVEQATAAGALVVAAAGNQGHDARQDSPGGLDGVVSVGAAGDGGLASYSNFGPLISLLAPGDQVLSTQPGGYAYESGSSQAAALVSASAALVKSLRPDFDPPHLKALLQASADSSWRCTSPANQASPGCGAGLLDVGAALDLAAACGADCPAPPSPTVLEAGCGAVPGRPPAGLTLLFASAICALLRRKRWRRSGSSAKTSP